MARASQIVSPESIADFDYAAFCRDTYPGGAQMPELSLDALPLLLALVVPGFVWSRVHQYFQVAPKSGEPGIAHSLTLSGINLALSMWLVPRLWVSTLASIKSLTAPSWAVTIGWVFVSLLTPAILGSITGLANRRGRLRDWASRVAGINIPSPIGTGWDFVFCDVAFEAALWASVTLTDGSVVEGIFASKSMASSDKDERDLYLETYYRPGADGSLAPVEHSAGIWVSASAIKAIEFKWIQTETVNVPSQKQLPADEAAK